ncbi:MAG: DUF4349 domain-containing protein [Humibacillus sp.]
MTVTTSPVLRPTDAAATPPATTGGARRRRWPDLGPSPRRPLLVVLAVVLLVLIAVPVGLSQLRGGGASSVASRQGFGQGLGQGVGQPERSGTLDSSAGSSAGSPADGSVGAAPDAPAAANPGLKTPSSGPALTGVTGAKVARSAWLGLQVADLAGAAGRARSIASAAGGSVLTEDISTAVDPLGGAKGIEPRGVVGSSGSSGSNTSIGAADSVRSSGPLGGVGSVGSVGLYQGRLTLSVPEPKLDGVLTELSTLGTISYRSAQAQDVTASDIDTRARIEPARASIERVRALMAKSTDLQQLLSLESELTRRQSDLDSLTQQLADLDRRTTMSDVTVTLWTPAAADQVSADSGVVASLRSAWEGLLGSLTVIVTGLAVLLPWLLLAGLGTLLWVRVARRRRASVTAATAAPAASPATTATTASASSLTD